MVSMNYIYLCPGYETAGGSVRDPNSGWGFSYGCQVREY